VVLFRDGTAVGFEERITSKDFPVSERGVYRVEVLLPEISRGPWIISNPIYVR
jgi:hypothetical protein